MSQFDPDAFLGIQAEDQSQTADSVPMQTAVPEAPAEFDVNSFLGVTPGVADPNMPETLNGSTFDTPIAGESAVDVKDRFKLALGNEEGRLDYLKNKFGVENVVENSMGAISIKGQDSKWRLVDPNTLDAPDAWDLTKRIKLTGKEALAELAEFAPEAVRMVSGLGKVAGVGTLGVTAAAGVGVDLGLTSMGRAFGTYKGDLTDQIKDATFEGALNALGWGIEKGAKPALSYLAKTDMFKKIGSNMARLTDDNLRALKQILPIASGGRITEASIDTVREFAPEVDRLVKSKGASDSLQFQDLMREEASAFASKAADALERGRSEIASRLYGSVADDVVEGSIKLRSKDLVDPVMSQFNTDGLTKIAGKSWQQSKQLLEEQGGKLLPGQTWEILSFKEMSRLVQKVPGLPDAVRQAATDSKVYNELISPIRSMSNYRGQAMPVSSKEQVKELIKLRQAFSNITYDAKVNSAASPVSRYFAGTDSAIDQISKSVLPSSSLEKLAKADEVYADIMQSTDQLRKVSKATDSAAAERVINAMFSGGSSVGSKRNAIQRSFETLTRYGAPSSASQMAEAAKQIQLRKAAVDFTGPIFKSLSPATVFSVASGGAALTSDDPSIPAGLSIGAIALGSPRGGYRAIKTQLATNALLRTAFKAAADPITKAAVSNGAIKNLVTVGIRTAQAADEANQAALSSIPGAQGQQ